MEKRAGPPEVQKNALADLDHSNAQAVRDRGMVYQSMLQQEAALANMRALLESSDATIRSFQAARDSMLAALSETERPGKI